MPECAKSTKIIDGELHEYNEQEEVEKVIQQECEVRFTLAHSAPIMRSLLGERLRYLDDEEIARQIITGTYKIPVDLDPAITLELEEIGRMGVQLVNGEGEEIIISPEDRGLQKLLEKSERIHLLVIVRDTLRTLQGRSTGRSQLKINVTTTDGHSEKRNPSRKLERRAPSHAGEDCRCMSSEQTTRNPTVPSRLQLLQPIYLWSTGNEQTN